MRRVPSKHRNRPLVRERDHGALTRLGLVLVCGLVLASGFVYAGVQHFGALRIGYETEKLRADLEKAQQEQRRLVLQREAAASPVRLERAARQLGMQPMTPAQIDPLRRHPQAGEGAAVTAGSPADKPISGRTPRPQEKPKTDRSPERKKAR